LMMHWKRRYIALDYKRSYFGTKQVEGGGWLVEKQRKMKHRNRVRKDKLKLSFNWD
jgi:hypothetical protein